MKNHRLHVLSPQLKSPSFKAGKGEDNFSIRNTGDEACFPLDYFFLTSASSLSITSIFSIVSLLFSFSRFLTAYGKCG